MDTKLLMGVLETLILEVISEAPSYGYQIAQRVKARSEGRFELKEGSLYPALHRLERQKLLSANWDETDGRPRKYYRLTTQGVRALRRRRDDWFAFASGVNQVLGYDGA